MATSNTLLRANTAVTSAATVWTIDSSESDWVAFHLDGTFVATVVVEESFDGTNWVAVALVTSTGDIQANATAPGFYVAQTLAPRTRVRVSAYTSGTLIFRGGTTEISSGGPIEGRQTITANVVLATGTGYVRTSTADTNLATIKGSAGNLMEFQAFNPTASPVFVKLFNKASAPVLGTDPVVMTLPVAAGAYADLNLGNLGKRFTNGIALAITGASGSADATAVGAGVQVSATYI